MGSGLSYWQERTDNFVVSHQEHESLNELLPVLQNLSTNATTERISNAKGKIRASMTNDDLSINNPTQDTGNSASPFRGQTVDEIQEVIKKQLIHRSCTVATKLLDHRLNINESRITTIENDQKLPRASSYTCTFLVEWGVEEFWIEQCKMENEEKLRSLESVIVLTGYAVDAQATTVGEYIRTNWPQSGPMLLGALQIFLGNGSSASAGMLTFLGQKCSKMSTFVLP